MNNEKAKQGQDERTSKVVGGTLRGTCLPRPWEDHPPITYGRSLTRKSQLSKSTVMDGLVGGDSAPISVLASTVAPLYTNTAAPPVLDWKYGIAKGTGACLSFDNGRHWHQSLDNH